MIVQDTKGQLVDDETGEIISADPSPKFKGWTRKDYENAFPEIRYIEVQNAHEVSKDEIPEEGYVAQEKFDGCRCLIFITSKGNRLFSRRVSKKTDWFTENTDTMPHIRDFPFPKEYYGTVLDGEIMFGSSSSEAISVTGSLPENALANQLEKGFAEFNCFDILYYKGLRVENFPYSRRLSLLDKFFEVNKNAYIVPTTLYTTQEESRGIGFNCSYTSSFLSLLESVWAEGKEGLMIKRLDAPYEQKRTKNYLKLKPHFFRDCIIMGYTEPTKEFDSEERKTDLKDWPYWERSNGMILINPPIIDDTMCPVTKPYAMGWIGAIIGGVYKDGKLVEIVNCKGISDKDLEYIKNNKKTLLGTVIEVEFNDFADKDKFTPRHPRMKRFREDKNPEECTWENWIDKE